MKVLVTGEKGFVGSVLCEELSRIGHEVVGASRSSGKDLEDIETWKSDLENCEVVIHTAARVHQMKENAENSVEKYRDINTTATIKLAEAASKYKVKKFIFLSSIKVNGEGEMESYTESSVPNPQDPYGISKYEAELGLKSICKRSNMDVCVIRPTLIYGRGVKANFRTLIKIVEKRLPLPIKLIKNKRSFLYIENLTSFIIDSMCREEKFSLYLLSDRKSYSTSELVKLISTELGVLNLSFPFPQKILKIALRVIGMKAIYQRIAGSLIVDSSKAHRVWTAPYTTVEGIKKTLSK